LEELESFRGR